MATTLTNPAATQGIDFGGILSNVLGAYTEVSKARIERDTAKYSAAAAIQAQTFNPPQANGMLEALGIGNARVPGTNASGVATSGGGLNLPMLGLIGVGAVAGFYVIKKLVK
jgi:hypothetical protein